MINGELRDMFCILIITSYLMLLHYCTINTQIKLVEIINTVVLLIVGYFLGRYSQNKQNKNKGDRNSK